MSLLFTTTTPQTLLDTYKTKIRQGHVKTWSVDADGDFTHTPDQFRNKVYLRPVVEIGGLRMRVLGNQAVVTTIELYGIYQGRFIESMISHCPDLFTTVSASPRPTNSDNVTNRARTG